MLLTPEIEAVFFGIKILLGIAAGTAAAFILHRWRPIKKRRLGTGAVLGVLGSVAGSLLTGWASEGTEHVNGHAANFRSWFADQEFSFPVLLTACLVIFWHLWLISRRHA